MADPNPEKQNNFTPVDRALLITTFVISILVLIALLFLVYHIVRDSKSVVSTIKQVPGIVEKFRQGLGEGASKATSIARRNIVPLVNAYIQNAMKKR